MSDAKFNVDDTLLSKDLQQHEEESKSAEVVVQNGFFRPGPGGVPMGVYYVLGGFAVICLILLLITLTRGAKKAPINAQSSQLERSIQNELGVAQQRMERLEAANKELAAAQAALRADTDARFANNGIEGVQKRMSNVEAHIDNLNGAVQILGKRVGDTRPLSDLVKQDMSGQVLSIGNGVARIRKENGEVVTLQAGDKWGSVSVISVRDEERIVVLSNGTALM